MTERELSYIKAIAEAKSFSKASQQLFVSQPSLSQCVANVEKELGTPIFIRSTKGLSLTGAGECYYNVACEILRRYSDFTQEISEFNELKRGKINIGIPAYLSLIILPKVLPTYNKLHPGIDIELVEKNSTELEDLLLSSTLDFSIVHSIPGYSDSTRDSLDFQILEREPFVIVLPHGHPAGRFSSGIDDITNLPILDIKCLEEHPFLLVKRGSRLRMFCDYLMQQANINPNIVLTTKNYETARRLACAGMGATLIPWEYLRIFGNSTDANYYAFPKRYDSAWNTSVATVKGSYVSKASRAFIDLAMQIYHR